MRETVTYVSDGQKWVLARIAGAAFVGGAAEALFLVLVTRTAFAIANDDRNIQLFGANFTGIRGAMAIALVCLVLRVLLALRVALDSARMSSFVVARTRRHVADAFLHSAWPTQAAQPPGALQEMMSVFAGQSSSLSVALGQAVLAGANLAAMLLLAVIVNPIGALVVTLAVGVLGSALRPLRGAVRRRSAASLATGSHLTNLVSELSGTGLEVQAFHVQDEANTRLNERIGRAERSMERLMFATGAATPLYIGLAYLALVGALSVASLGSGSDLSAIGAVMLVMLRSLSYAQSFQSATVTISSTAPAVDRIRDKLAEFEAARVATAGGPLAKVGAIEARSLGFHYTVGQPVLTNVSFAVREGEIVGVVGPSGGGKTTLVQLILGLRHPGTGALLMGGIPISDFARDEWCRNVAFVPQQPRLIGGTVADNVRFFRDLTDEQVVQACRLANLHHEIEAFPDGYERVLGAGGAQLSGGQQQRLCIARALAGGPRFLVLDEPTSALDVESEAIVTATLQGLAPSTAIVVVTHRPSTLSICDRVMVIEAGRLTAFATPDELLSDEGFFRRINAP